MNDDGVGSGEINAFSFGALLKNVASPLVGDEHRRITPPTRGGATLVRPQTGRSGSARRLAET